MVLALWGALAAQLHAQWKPVEGRIRTQWSEQVNPDNVLPEYPRPIMERTEWKNLNTIQDTRKVSSIEEFKKHDKTRFYQDNFVDSIDFDYLEIHIIEE